MLSTIRITAVLAALSFSPLTQAMVGTINQPAASSSATSQSVNPFGYERQRQKMMRPINDLLPQDRHDETPPVRE